MDARRERRIADALLVATGLLRLACAVTYRIDSDEPQHLHVAWGWAHGLLQYRDVFDNHAPLFHMVCAPLVAAIGERPEIVILMRLAMLPLYAIALFGVYVLGRSLYGERVGLWAAVLTALFPSFFLTGLEFRADDLWATWWLLALATLVSGSVGVCRSAVVGLFLGLAFATSLKTVLLVLALTLATGCTVALTRERGRSHVSLHLARCAIVLILGMAIVPLGLVWFFARRGALQAMLYGTISHNVLPRLGEWHAHPLRPLILVLVLPLLWRAGRAVVAAAPCTTLARRRGLVFFTAGCAFAPLVSVWPIVTPEDFLPLAPLATLLAVGTLLSPHPAPRRTTWHRRQAALVAFAATEVVIILALAMPWQRNASAETALLSDVLALTRPHEYVMDAKGEMVFRRRAFPYALEALTKARLQRGLLADSIPERLIATRAPVVTVDDHGFPPRARAFMRANYVSVGRVRVLGRALDVAADGDTGRLSFDVAVPARYAIVTDAPDCALWLDGTRYTGARRLRSGVHELRTSVVAGRFALVWARAVARGFVPFATAHPCA